MKCLTKIAAMLITVMLLFLCIPIRNVSADDAQDLYTLTDYNSSIVTDPDGNIVRGYSYCLNYKLKTPAGNTYTRVPLSSFDEYSSLEKARLAKLVVYRDDILDYCFNTYGIENVFASERDNFFLPSLSTLNVTSGINDVASFDVNASHFTARGTVIQHLVWAVVHSDFDSYVHLKIALTSQMTSQGNPLFFYFPQNDIFRLIRSLLPLKCKISHFLS